jgi:hypothetical protein
MSKESKTAQQATASKSAKSSGSTSRRRKTPFKPSASHPCIERDITLHSTYPQRVFDKIFERTQHAIYAVVVMTPVLGTQQDAAQFNEVLQEMYERVEFDLREQIAQMKELLATHEIKDTVAYTDTSTRKASLYTPECGRFADMLTQFDEIVSMADTLWMGRAWKREQRSECIFHWRRVIMRFANDLMDLQKRSRDAVDRFAAEKQAKAEAKKAAEDGADDAQDPKNASTDSEDDADDDAGSDAAAASGDEEHGQLAEVA